MTNPSTRGRSNRLKGQRGERQLAAELSDLLGITLKRRVRNHANESDIEGLPGFSVEVKNCAELRLAEWWKQTVSQASGLQHPVLFYKIPRKGFRAVISASTAWEGYQLSTDVNYTVEMSIPAFAMWYRDYFS